MKVAYALLMNNEEMNHQCNQLNQVYYNFLLSI